MCVPLVDKSSDSVVRVYLKEIYCRFRGRQKLLSDNRSEFTLWKVAVQHEVKKIHSSPYTCQKMEGLKLPTSSLKLL